MKKYILFIFKINLLLLLFPLHLLFAYDHQYPPSWKEFQRNEGWKLSQRSQSHGCPTTDRTEKLRTCNADRQKVFQDMPTQDNE